MKLPSHISDPIPSPQAPVDSRMKLDDEEGATNTGSNLFVTGIHPRLTEADVSRLFEKYGEVENCSIMLDPHTKESRGFGFVKMVTTEQAEAAKEGLQGEVIEGRTLSIEKARRARPRTPTPGKYFGPPKRGMYISVFRSLSNMIQVISVVLPAEVVIVIAMMIDGVVILLAVKSIAGAPASTTTIDEATVAAAEEIVTMATVAVGSIATKADVKMAMVLLVGTVVAIKTGARTAAMIVATQHLVMSLLATTVVIASTHGKIVMVAGKLVDSRALFANSFAHEQGKCNPRMTLLSILSIVSRLSLLGCGVYKSITGMTRQKGHGPFIFFSAQQKSISWLSNKVPWGMPSIAHD